MLIRRKPGLVTTRQMIRALERQIVSMTRDRWLARYDLHVLRRLWRER